MDKPTVYLDTNVVSAYWYEGRDRAAAARRIHTREWWDVEREHFTVCVSVTTLNELRAGVFRRQSDCLKLTRGLQRLAMNRQTKALLEMLLSERVVPETKPGDALQMAVSAAHEIDYLLTWNYSHLANPIAQKRLESVCQGLGLRAPLVVSPETIPQVRLGHDIRRRK